jgi:replicative DNA helicase
MAGNKPFNKQTEPRDFQVEGMKVPPHSIEAEQSVLGGLMLDNERWDDVAERVVADDFYTRPHRHIFTEMHRLQEMGKPIDLITLAESLELQGQLDSVGGFAYLAELSKNTPSAANISAYADIVRERAVVREMISVANEIANAGFDPQGRTSEDLLDLAESGFSKLRKAAPTKTKARKTSRMCLRRPLRVLSCCSSSRTTALPASIPAMTTSTKNRRSTAVGSDHCRRASIDG